MIGGFLLRCCLARKGKVGSGIQKVMGGDIQTHRQHGDRINLLSFFQNKESKQKVETRIWFMGNKEEEIRKNCEKVNMFMGNREI
jgi:hypothetical protein